MGLSRRKEARRERTRTSRLKPIGAVKCDTGDSGESLFSEGGARPRSIACRSCIYHAVSDPRRQVAG